jgi:hypothetical protein
MDKCKLSEIDTENPVIAQFVSRVSDHFRKKTNVILGDLPECKCQLLHVEFRNVVKILDFIPGPSPKFKISQHIKLFAANAERI